VLAALVLIAWPVLAMAPIVGVAANRLVSAEGVPIVDLQAVGAGAWIVLLAGLLALLTLACGLPAHRRVHAMVAGAAMGLVVALLTVAGAEATHRTADLPTQARISLGGGFWALVMLSGLAAADALRRLGLKPAVRSLALLAALALPLALLLARGHLSDLSLLQEHAQRREVFEAAGWQHLQIVAAGLLPALLAGVPLGIAAAHRPEFGRALLAGLNLLQTVPSIALFALLIAPFGVGLVPAGIALTLYALLPVVHGVHGGLAQVPAASVDAARGMGMTPSQIFLRVRLPLALPVWLAALRVTTVQVIGLAVVAALIGAGGFGSLVFQGLASSALDLVLLGVLPVVALAMAADAVLGGLAAAMPGHPA
jgi:osmoprotectant transport system permease protein